MLKTIVTPLDGSALSEQALAYAVVLARPTGNCVVLIRAVLAHTLPGVDPTEAQVSVRRDAEAYLDTIAERLRMGGIEAEPHVYYDDAADAILDAARAQHADLIVMSTHGRAGLGRWVYGSVADQVLRHSEVPVLLVPAACRTDWAAGQPGCILVPLDGSELAEGAIASAADLARILDAPVRLLRVVEYPAPLLADGAPYLATFDPFAEQSAALAYLQGIADELRADGLAVEIESVVAPPGLVDQVATTIADVARDQGAVAIALATHGRGGVARLVLGSVASGVIQRGGTPLLLVRPRAAGQGAQKPIDVPAASALPTTVTLTAAEHELVRRGLTVLLYGAPCRNDARGQPVVDGMEAAAVQALLARLAQTEAARVGDPTLVARSPP